GTLALKRCASQAPHQRVVGRVLRPAWCALLESQRATCADELKTLHAGSEDPAYIHTLRRIQRFPHPLLGTIPAPSRTVTRWFAATRGITSRAPLGQKISILTVAMFPRPKWRRGSFAE